MPISIPPQILLRHLFTSVTLCIDTPIALIHGPRARFTVRCIVVWIISGGIEHSLIDEEDEEEGG
jgi:hypothetical protein